MDIYTLESTSIEKIPMTIETSTDPTGGTVSFALTTGGNTEPSTFSNGEWISDSWELNDPDDVQKGGTAKALTPLAGAGQTLAVTADTDYMIYARWSVGVETPTRRAVGTLRVT